MIAIFGLLIGAAFGAARAKRRGGKGLDIAQYAAVYGLIFGVLGLFVTIFIERSL